MCVFGLGFFASLGGRSKWNERNCARAPKLAQNKQTQSGKTNQLAGQSSNSSESERERAYSEKAKRDVPFKTLFLQSFKVVNLLSFELM